MKKDSEIWKPNFLRELVIDDDDLITLGTIDDCEQELNIYKQALDKACKFIDKYEWELCYLTEITRNDVVGYLTNDDVLNLLEAIKNL